MQEPTAKISEIFTSIQGEGPFVGQKQVFIRFSKCNLACKYCDTDFKNAAVLFAPLKLVEKINDIDCDIISLTGGEPLLEVEDSAFLLEFLKLLKAQPKAKKIYLETNGTKIAQLKKIIDFIDIVSMDIKIESATGQKNRFKENEEFLKTAIENNKKVFVKIVFDKNIKDDEIEAILKIAKKYNVEIILQPKMPLDKGLDMIKIFDKFYNQYKNVRLIPQVHKFLNII